MQTKRIAFFGASSFANDSLSMLAQNGYPLLVVSIPPRPMGRKLSVQENVVASLAKSLNLPLFCPENVNSPESLKRIQDFKADIIITASFGAYFGKRLREAAPLCLNLHPSLLPLLRGATPIQSALLQGFSRTGLSIFEMEKHMDAGPILLQRSIPILESDNYSSLHEKLSELAAIMLLDYLKAPYSCTATAQEDALATYCSKIEPQELFIDWNQDASAIHNQVRAFSLEPGARTHRRGQILKILATKLTDIEAQGPAGTVNQIVKNAGFIINCGSGALQITQVQAQGKKSMDAHSYLLGARFEPNEQFGN